MQCYWRSGLLNCFPLIQVCMFRTRNLPSKLILGSNSESVSNAEIAAESSSRFQHSRFQPNRESISNAIRCQRSRQSVSIADNRFRTADNWFRTFHNHIKIPENLTPWKGTTQQETLDSLARELESASTFERMSHNRDRHSGISPLKHSTPRSLLR